MSPPAIFDGAEINTSLVVYEYIVSKRNIKADHFELAFPALGRIFLPDVSNLDFTSQAMRLDGCAQARTLQHTGRALPCG